MVVKQYIEAESMAKNFIQYMREYFSPQNVYEAIRPLVSTSSYFGLLPIRLTGKRPDRHYRVSRLCYLTTVLHLILFVVSLTRSLGTSSLFSHFILYDNVARVSELFQLITAFAAMGVVYAVCFAKRYCFVAFVDMLNQIDRSLATLGVVHNFVAMFRSICWDLLATSLIFIAYIGSCVVLVVYSDHTVGVTTFVTYFLPHTVVAQIVYKYRMITRQIICRMSCVNEVGEF